ncbi:hypothetical protein DRE_00945 [Drechslerella stenobrocha 248]|uniref:Uncharacterized protein n=1 Tax=Drechslerella stenobrocha 248 TaxID=1043628 RepID=W7HLK5_9PEZI|nr:hypothetical protein DRE_00945 [Drechslerella stenobrocha 248]
MVKDHNDCVTCQNCFERQLAWAKNELERIEVWRFVGVNILQRDFREAKIAELKGYHDFTSRILEPPKDKKSQETNSARIFMFGKGVGGGSPRVVELDDNGDEIGDAASDSSDSDCDPNSSGVNHPILKKMDDLYEDLAKDFANGSIIPQGVAEVMRSIRKARYHVERRKIAEADHAQRRQKSRNPTKKRRKRSKETDPACSYTAGVYDEPLKVKYGQGNPLQSSYDAGSFKWAPSHMDAQYFSHKMHTPRSYYYASNEELSRLDHFRTGYLQDADYRTTWETWHAANIKEGRKEWHWQEIYRPTDWEDGMDIRVPKRKMEAINTDEGENPESSEEDEGYGADMQAPHHSRGSATDVRESKKSKGAMGGGENTAAVYRAHTTGVKEKAKDGRSALPRMRALSNAFRKMSLHATSTARETAGEAMGTAPTARNMFGAAQDTGGIPGAAMRAVDTAMGVFEPTLRGALTGIRVEDQAVPSTNITAGALGGAAGAHFASASALEALIRAGSNITATCSTADSTGAAGFRKFTLKLTPKQLKDPEPTSKAVTAARSEPASGRRLAAFGTKRLKLEKIHRSKEERGHETTQKQPAKSALKKIGRKKKTAVRFAAEIEEDAAGYREAFGAFAADAAETPTLSEPEPEPALVRGTAVRMGLVVGCTPQRVAAATTRDEVPRDRVWDGFQEQVDEAACGHI